MGSIGVANVVSITVQKWLRDLLARIRPRTRRRGADRVRALGVRLCGPLACRRGRPRPLVVAAPGRGGLDALRAVRRERLDVSHDLQQVLLAQLLLVVSGHQRLAEALDDLRLRVADRVAYVALVGLDRLAAFESDRAPVDADERRPLASLAVLAVA